MTALLIIAAVIAFIVMILYFPLNAEIKYIDGKFDFKIKFLWFTFYPPKEKKPKKRKKKLSKRDKSPPAELPSETADEAASSVDTSDESDNNEPGSDPDKPQFEGIDITYTDKKQDKRSDTDAPDKKKISGIIDEIKEKIELVRLLWSLAGKNVMKILGDIRIDDVCADITAAAEDACQAALLYGRLNAAVWNIIGFAKYFVKMSVKRINIKCSFEEGKAVYDLSARINMRPAVVIGNVLAAGFKLLVNINKLKKYFPSDDKTEAESK